MLRPIVALALLALAAVFALDAQKGLEPRGVTLSVWNNPTWEGTPSRETTMRHLDFGEAFEPNRFALAPQTSARLEGWLYAPRAGAYDFAVASESAAWLRLDGRAVLAHRRDRTETKITTRLTRGIHHLRIDLQHRKGDSHLSVKWRLPSGYMKLSALPPVFVRPAARDADPTESPRPGGGPTLPLAHRLAPALLGALALGVLFLPWVAERLRRLRDPRSRRRLLLGALVFGGALGVRLVDLNGAGETSDEWAYAGAGRIYVSNIAHGYWESEYWHTNEEHPPIGKYLYGLVSHLSGTDDYTPLRATAAVLGALTVLLVWRLGVRYLTVRAALLGAVTLALMPAFIAHNKVAALDSPSAFLAALSAFLFIRSFDFDGVASTTRNVYLLLAAFVASLAFSTKFSNVLVFVFMVLVIVVDQWQRIRRRGIIEVPLAVYALPILPFVVLVGFWPWLWADPFAQLVKTLTHWDYPVSEWFLGEFRRPPIYYYFVSVTATTPVLLLVPFTVFLVGALRRRTRFELIVLLWFATPFLWSISSLKQDGVRYVYNVFPALALGIGAGADRLLGLVPRVSQRVLTPLAASALAAYTGWQSWLVHPYYLDYYNEAFGGPKGAFLRSNFEVGWWGEGLDRAIDWMNANAPRAATWDCQGVVTHTFDGLRKDLVNRPRDPEFIVHSYLTPRDLARPGFEAVYRVDAAGAPIVIVWRRLPQEPDAPRRELEPPTFQGRASITLTPDEAPALGPDRSTKLEPSPHGAPPEPPERTPHRDLDH